MLCYVMLCYVMLCYVMLCYLISSYLIFSSYFMLYYNLLCYIIYPFLSYIYYIMIKKWNQKNMKQCDKPKSHISSNFLWSIYLPIMVDTLLIRHSRVLENLSFRCGSFRLKQRHSGATVCCYGTVHFVHPISALRIAMETRSNLRDAM